MKARATLLMALPNKDQLNFHTYQDAKLLMEAIENKGMRGNKESRKCIAAETLTQNASESSTLARNHWVRYDWSYQGEEEQQTNHAIDGIYHPWSSSSVQNLNNLDETSGNLKTFITKIENQLDHKVKVIRSDNGTEFKNSIMNQFCEIKGIKREFSVARTPQQNVVAKKKNRTLIKAARTMLVDSKLPTTFWEKVVNTACYVLNRVLVIKPHNKTPYELICGRPPLIDFMKPFRCLVTILNTMDHLGKFEGKADEGYFVRYSMVSKAMRVFNKRTRIFEETLNIRFLKILLNVKGNRPYWLFDLDSLSISMNYVPVVAGNKTNGIVGIKDNTVTGQGQKEKEPEQEYILIPICTTDPSVSQGPKDREKDTEVDENESIKTQVTPISTARPTVDTAVPSPPVNTARPSVNTANALEEHLFERFSPFKNAFSLPPVPNISSMDNTGIF
ncbi:putative ribonuclease H-like domain-containing protein, partial [Tanacetum coccineum]